MRDGLARALTNFATQLEKSSARSESELQDAVKAMRPILAEQNGISEEAREAVLMAFESALREATRQPESSHARQVSGTEETLFAKSGPALAEGQTAPLERPTIDEAGRYEDLGEIGIGGMGEVRRVKDRKLQRVVAMKLIKVELSAKAKLLQAFVREATIASHLDHSAIVPIYELGWLSDGRAYFTMKEVRGITLGAAIREMRDSSGWTLLELVSAFRRACDAVAYAHRRGIVHRDLKPDNMLIDHDGNVVVLDWGLAEPIPGHDGMSVVLQPTGISTAAGTPAYMPPEQFAGLSAALFPTADVYALGGVLHAILTGSPPVRSHLTAATATGNLGAERSERPKDVPARLWAIAKKAMSSEPHERYADADAFASALGEWIEQASKKSVLRFRPVYVLTLASTLGFVGILIWILNQSTTPVEAKTVPSARAAPIAAAQEIPQPVPQDAEPVAPLLEMPTTTATPGARNEAPPMQITPRASPLRRRVEATDESPSVEAPGAGPVVAPTEPTKRRVPDLRRSW